MYLSTGVEAGPVTAGGNTGGILNTLQGPRGGGQTETISGAEAILRNVTEFQAGGGFIDGRHLPETMLQ